MTATMSCKRVITGSSSQFQLISVPDVRTCSAVTTGLFSFAATTPSLPCPGRKACCELNRTHLSSPRLTRARAPLPSPLAVCRTHARLADPAMSARVNDMILSVISKADSLHPLFRHSRITRFTPQK